MSSMADCVVHARAEFAGDLGNAATGEQREMVAHDARRRRFAAAFGGELGEQAFLQVLAADAGRLEGFQELDRGLHSLERQVGLQRDIGRCLREKAMVIEAADEMAHGIERGWIDVGERGAAMVPCGEVSVTSESKKCWRFSASSFV